MLEAIEKLLVLQDRDRKISRLRNELANVGPERHALQTKTAASQAALDAARQRIKHIESDRKKLELEVETKKQAIERYSLQQFQTKKNDEQLELMEQADAAQKDLAAATRLADEAKTQADRQITDLTAREENLKKELATLEADRDQLAAAVDASVLPRYERLRRSKGENVVVGVAHGVCGGCHMKLQRQVIVTCQGNQEIVCCPNCGRILYYTRDMSLAVAD